MPGVPLCAMLPASPCCRLDGQTTANRASRHFHSPKSGFGKMIPNSVVQGEDGGDARETRACSGTDGYTLNFGLVVTGKKRGEVWAAIGDYRVSAR